MNLKFRWRDVSFSSFHFFWSSKIQNCLQGYEKKNTFVTGNLNLLRIKIKIYINKNSAPLTIFVKRIVCMQMLDKEGVYQFFANNFDSVIYNEICVNTEKFWTIFGKVVAILPLLILYPKSSIQLVTNIVVNKRGTHA